MASVMSPQGLVPSAPSTRQDIISELLDGYTYDESDKPSPPPTTQRDRKQEAIERMNTQFQLRELANAANAPQLPRKDSLDQSPKRIVSRSLSRSGTPPSLNLIVSNGSTAALPPTPVIYAPVKAVPSSLPRAAKELPPPPPPRSSRRKVAQEPPMGQHESKGDLERNDSFHSLKDPSPAEPRADTKNVAPVVARKPLPSSGVKKFVSLLELNQSGPRGNKIKPPTSAPRNLNAQQDINGGRASESLQAPSARPLKEPLSVSTTTNNNNNNSNNRLPPTPPEEKSILSPPRKALVGLPSNPRAKSPMSPLHIRGKSSTGFFLKAHRPAPPPPTTTANAPITVTTPEMTPSPTLKPEVRRDHDISPVTPLPPPTDQHRPFSYEAPAPAAQTQPALEPQPQTAPMPESQTSPGAPAPAQAVPDVQIHAAPEPQPTSPTPQAPTASTPTEPKPPVSAPTSPAEKDSPPVEAPQTQSPALVTTPPTTTTSPSPSPSSEEQPFTPLTTQPHPHPATLIPRITSAHLTCYTSHAIAVWSNNRFQSLGCMVCTSNAPDRKWTCAWCRLRVCVACSDKLCRVPGRRLEVVLTEREREGEQTVTETEKQDMDVDVHDPAQGYADVDVDVNTDASGYAALIHADANADASAHPNATDDARDRALRMSSIDEDEDEVYEHGRAAER